MKSNNTIIIFTLLLFFSVYKWFEYARNQELYFHKRFMNDDNKSIKEEILVAELRDKKKLTKIGVVAVVVVIFFGVIKPTQQFNFEKKDSESQYKAYINEYNNGWSDFCTKIFSRLGSNNYFIYGKNLQMTYPNCEAFKPSNAGVNNFNKHIGGYTKGDTVEHIGQTGRTQGYLDANDRIFTFSPYWCWGTECVTKYDLL
jgi:hypothetical protein